MRSTNELLPRSDTFAALSSRSHICYDNFFLPKPKRLLSRISFCRLETLEIRFLLGSRRALIIHSAFSWFFIDIFHGEISLFIDQVSGGVETAPRKQVLNDVFEAGGLRVAQVGKRSRVAWLEVVLDERQRKGGRRAASKPKQEGDEKFKVSRRVEEHFLRFKTLPSVSSVCCADLFAL